MTVSKQRETDRKKRLTKALDKIATARAKERNEKNKYSYVIHTSKEALKILGKRSRSHLNEEDLNRNYRRIKKKHIFHILFPHFKNIIYKEAL